MLSPDVLAALQRAHNEGYQYIVAIYKKCPLGKPGTVVSFHRDMIGAQSAISSSLFSDFLSFYVISVVLSNHSYFVKTR